MSIARTEVPSTDRRVRDQARDAALLMVFSAAASLIFASCFLLLTLLGR